MNKKSFTLIELLVVIAIIGILSSLVIARFSDWNDEARIANTLQWSAGVHRTLGASLVGHWPLNGDANDISGYGNDGTMYNFIGEPENYWIDGVSGTGNQALRFNGINNFIDYGDVEEAKTDTFSISVWAYPITRKNYSSILTNFGSDYRGWRFMYTSDGELALGIAKNSDGGYNCIESEDGIVLAGKWQHIIGIKTGTDVTFYINGENFTGGELAESTIKPSVSNLKTGYESNNASFLDGKLADVRIYDTALTTEEVGRIYAESKDSYLVYE